MSFYTRRMRMMLPLAALLITAMLSLALPAQLAFADGPGISIKSEVGYEGKVKFDKWNPLKLTLTSDQDISGDIVVQVLSQNGAGFHTSYVQHVELPKDTPKEVLLGLPGTMLNKDNNQILFYEESYKKGKPIPFASGKNYVQANPYNGALIGVLSDDPDTMNFMNVLNGKGTSINILPLKAASIPVDAMLLSGLDVLVINNFASDTLSEPQRQAIVGWVNGGGTLVLAGGAGYTKTAAPFAEIAPVTADGTTAVNELPELEKLGGKPLKLGGDFTISTVTPVKDAKTGIQAANEPLFASHDYGQGKVQYAAYDLAMEPVSSWAGHPVVWTSVLQGSLPVGSQNTYYNPLIDNLNYVLDYFPSLSMPSFTLLLWMLIIYAVVVAPVLYFILKKFDKREWAWFLIPVIAIIASGAVYMAGSADKTKELAHTINIIEMNGRGSAVKTTATAFFTPRSGNYELEFPSGMYLRTSGSRSSFGGGMDESKSFVRKNPDSTTVELRDMSQWSLAKVWAESERPEKLGRMETDLKLDAKGQLSGTVMNDTTGDLTEVVLVIGGKGYKLGDIPKGGSAQIPQDPKQILNFMGGDIAGMLYPYSQNDDKYRQRDIISNYAYSNRTVNTDKAFVLGWSSDHLTNYSLKKQEVSSDQLNFWVQPVAMTWGQSGKINVPYGFLAPEISQVNAPIFSSYGNGIELGQGSLIAEFPLISDQEVAYSEFSIKGIKPNNNVKMEIWNAQKNEWEQVNGSGNELKVTENPERYILNNRIRFMLNAADQTNFQMPELSVKGEVKP